MSPAPSARAAQVPTFKVMDVLKAAADRQERHPDTRVLHLEVGQPASPAPAPVARAAASSLQDQSLLGYTAASGTGRLRQGISEMYADCYPGLEHLPGPDHVLVTTGSSGAFVVAFTGCFDAGDRVAVAVPGYPCYRNVLSALGCTVVPIAVSKDQNYQPTLEQLIHANDGPDGPLKGLVLASPSNPTGTVIERSTLKTLCDYCTSEGLHLISDEIYHRLTYDVPAVTALSFKPDAIIINSFSKYYSMTGWRVGWIVVQDAQMRQVIETLLQNMFICAPALSQDAANMAFSNESRFELESHLAKYRCNREILLRRLPESGFPDIHPCQGAFYIYANVSKLLELTSCSTSADLCKQILDDTAVALTPGNDFDPLGGSNHIRFSFAQSTADMDEACDRLASWTAKFSEQT